MYLYIYNIYICIYFFTYICICIYIYIYMHTYIHIHTAYPACDDIFESIFKAQSSLLERVFCHVSVKRDVRACRFKLRNCVQKCHRRWDRSCIYVHIYMHICIYIFIFYIYIYIYRYIYINVRIKMYVGLCAFVLAVA